MFTSSALSLWDKGHYRQGVGYPKCRYVDIIAEHKFKIADLSVYLQVVQRVGLFRIGWLPGKATTHANKSQWHSYTSQKFNIRINLSEVYT